MGGRHPSLPRAFGAPEQMSLIDSLSALNFEEIAEIQDIWHEAHAEILIEEFRKSRSREEWKAYISKKPPSAETIALLIVLAVEKNAKVNGKAGATNRHAPMAALRSWAIEKYKAGEWKSANQAAHSLKESIIKHGRTINAHLSEENAQRTIAEWFRKSV